MKHKIILTLAIVLANVLLFAQSQKGIQYQIIVFDDNSNLVQNQQVVLDIEILKGSTSGAIVYSETHSTSTSIYGTAIITIGKGNIVTGNFYNINWGDDHYFLCVKNGSRILNNDLVLSVPYAKHAEKSYNVKSLDYSQLSNDPDFSEFDKNPDDDFNGNYKFLKEDVPNTIKVPERVDSMVVSEAIDLVAVANDNRNSDVLLTPEFGYKAGNVAEGNTVWKYVEGNMIHTGQVGVNTAIPSDFGGNGMKVNGAIQFGNLILGYPIPESKSGILYYNNSGSGSFYFYNENGDAIILNTGVIDGGGTNHKGYLNYLYNYSHPNDGMRTARSFVVGNGASIDRNTGDHSMVLASNTPIIKFFDTSISSSFPTNDWSLNANDISEGGENYFAIADISAGTLPFKIYGSTFDHTIKVAESGNVGLGIDTPTEKLEVNGTVKGSFVGDISKFSDIEVSGKGSRSVENLGSTTIVADNNADDVGQIEFKVKDTIRAVIDNNGNVGLGKIPEVELDINGTGSFDELKLKKLDENKFRFSVHKETISGFSNNIDVSDKCFVLLSASGIASAIIIQSEYTIGQEITIVSRNSSLGILVLNNVYENGSIAKLNANESLTAILTESGWTVIDRVN